jgi:triacylglycerol esterase/lipase EstA (alpha/beta hydrolase family)
MMSLRRIPVLAAVTAAIMLSGSPSGSAEMRAQETNPILFVHGMYGSPVNFVTFSSACDGVVEPEWTKLTGAINEDVGCVSHFALLRDSSVFDRIRAAVG